MDVKALLHSLVFHARLMANQESLGEFDKAGCEYKKTVSDKKQILRKEGSIYTLGNYFPVASSQL